MRSEIRPAYTASSSGNTAYSAARTPTMKELAPSCSASSDTSTLLPRCAMLESTDRRMTKWTDTGAPSLAHALDSSDACRKKRSLPLRQRKKIQAVLRRGGTDQPGLRDAGSAAVRYLHGLLRRLGQGHDPGPRDEARPAVPLPWRRLLQHLRAPAGRPVPEFRLRVVAGGKPLSGGIQAGPPWRADHPGSMENEDRLYPALGRARPGRAAARMDARIKPDERSPVLPRSLGRALRLRAEGIPDRDARQARARRAPVVESIRLLKNASKGAFFCSL